MRFWRGLFVGLITLAVVYSLSIGGQFSIDTGLADVAPKIATSAEAKAATQDLRKNIEQRIILLVSGADEDAVFDATEQLLDALEGIEQLAIVPSGDELAEQVIQGLAPFRFVLLSDEQRQRLVIESIEAIAQHAERDALSIGAARLYPFNQDPFGVTSESILSLLQAFAAERNANSENVFYQTIPLLISGDALSMNQQAALTAQLDDVIALAKQNLVSIDRSGVFFFAAHAAKESKRDVSLISTVSTLGVVVLLLFVFRSMTALLLPLISIAVGVGFAFVATHAVFGNVHVLTIVFGASLIGIVIDYSLHYFYHSAKFTGSLSELETSSRSVSAEAEYHALHRALLLSLCTSLIGYAALSFSGLDALNKVALFSCSGLLMAWLCVVVLGQRLVVGRLTINVNRLGSVVALLRSLVKPLPWGLVKSAALLSIVAAAISWLVFEPANDDPRAFFNAPAALLQSERNVAQYANDFEPGRYVLIESDTLQGLQARYQEAVSALLEKTSLPRSTFSSALEFVPADLAQESAYQLQSKLYQDEGALDLLAQALDFSVDSVAQIKQQYREAENRFLSVQDLQKLLGAALPPTIHSSPDQHLAFVLVRKGADVAELQSALAELPGVEYVNTLARTQSALAAQRVSAAWLLGLAYILVAGVLLARFRSIKALGMLLVPLSASAMLIVLAAPVGYELNLFHFMALFLVLGFGMDYTIFVREMSAHQSKTLQAILLSAVTSLLSFGLLSLSSIPVVASFGTALLIGNSFNLLGAFAFASVHDTESNQLSN